MSYEQKFNDDCYYPYKGRAMNIGKMADAEIKKLQATPCSWCNDTSQRIDSIEYQLEVELEAKKRHLERNEGYFSVICEALEIDHKSKLSDMLIAIGIKDKAISDLHKMLFSNYYMNLCECGEPDCQYCENEQDVAQLLSEVGEKFELAVIGQNELTTTDKEKQQ